MKTVVKFCLISFFICSFLAAGETIQTVGNLIASSYCKLGSQAIGKIDNIYVEVGDYVNKDQVLMTLDNRYAAVDLAQKEAFLEITQADFKNAERELKRVEKLWLKKEGESPSISKKQFEDAQSFYEKTLAQLRQAQESLKRSQLDMEEKNLKAPFDGVVAKKLVDLGETVITAPGVYLLEIASIDPLFLEFSVPQKYLSSLRLGQTVSFQIDGYKDETFEAKIDLIYPLLDESTRSVKCRANIENKELHLRPGLLAKVVIKQ